MIPSRLEALCATAVLLSGVAVPVSAAASTGDDSATTSAQTAFDLQAHRGGLGLTTEESPEAFAKALRMGVSTLELDTQVTKDLKVVVTHDRKVSADKCADTAPVVENDPMYPYVGKFIKDKDINNC